MNRRRAALCTALTAFGLVAFAAPATAAVVPATLVQSVSANQTTAGATLTRSGVAPTAAGQLMLAFLASDGPGTSGSQSFSGVTGCNTAWTLVKRANTQPGTAEIWKAASAEAGPCTVTATRTNGSWQGAIAVTTYSGGAVGVTAGASANSGAAKATLTGMTAGSAAWGVGSDYTSATTRTLLAGQTMVNQMLASIGDTYWVQKFTDNVPQSLTLGTSAPGGNPRKWNFVAIEVKGVDSGPPPPTACGDGLDNDADGKVDYPADPGCTATTDTDEADPSAPPPAVCADGIDNDADSKVDYPADPGCTSGTDTDEADPVAPPTGEPLAQPGRLPRATADNTGPTVTAFVPASGNITTNGAVIEGREYNTEITIDADDVTIRNTRFNAGFVLALSNRVTIEDSYAGAGISISSSTDVTIRRTEIRGAGDLMHVTSDRGVQNRNIMIDTVWGHDTTSQLPSHVDGIQIRGVNGLTLKGSDLDLGNFQDSENAAWFTENANGGNSGIQVIDCWMNGGGFTFRYAAGTIAGPWTVTGLRIRSDYNWGPTYDPSQGGAPTTQTDNWYQRKDGTWAPLPMN